MPRINDDARFEPKWVETDAQRLRWRRSFAMGLLYHLGFSPAWIASVLRSSDTNVREMVKTPEVRAIDFSQFIAVQEGRIAGPG